MSCQFKDFGFDKERTLLLGLTTLKLELVTFLKSFRRKRNR